MRVNDLNRYGNNVGIYSVIYGAGFSKEPYNWYIFYDITDLAVIDMFTPVIKFPFHSTKLK